MLQALIDASQEPVSGTVRLKLYKGTVSVLGRRSPESLYDEDVVTFEDDRGAYSQADAEGFIRLNALRLRPCRQAWARPQGLMTGISCAELRHRLPDQFQQFLRVQPRRCVGVLQEAVGQVLLVPVQFDDLVFDGALGDEAVDGYRAGLADAVGAVRGLILHCRVPPRVHVDDIVGGGEVQTGAASLQ